MKGMVWYGDEKGSKRDGYVRTNNLFGVVE